MVRGGKVVGAVFFRAVSGGFWHRHPDSGINIKIGYGGALVSLHIYVVYGGMGDLRRKC